MGHIVALDENMINMIAAGEVIERPANVVKELVENSIDAGATKITVSVKDGGRKSILVTDNGCGMDADDLARAFEPHTTSKIRRAVDLSGISTLGFRGEALASIASVAQVRAASLPRAGTTGLSIEVDCGDKGALRPCSAAYGTQLEVRDLFYKLPARRKFLKTANTEMTHITEQFRRVALGSGLGPPGRDETRQTDAVQMTLLSNGREVYRLGSREPVAGRIAKLFSPEISENLIESQSSEKGLRIFALLGKPCASRTNSKFQYVFLNGRYIRDKFISHAVREAYRGLLETNRCPVVFLFIRMPYEDYDINVHPKKTEVRFYNANLVHSQILAVLREKLLGTNLDVAGKLPPVKSAGDNLHSQRITDAMAEFFQRYKRSSSQEQFKFPTAAVRSRVQGKGEHGPDAAWQSAAETIEIPQPAMEKKFLQIHDSFIVAQTPEGFVIIDQHALHERILYERLQAQIGKRALQSQKLLVPESFIVTDSQAQAIRDNSHLIERLGIELVGFGPGVMAVQSFPTLLAKASPLEFVRDLVDLLDRTGSEPDSEALLDKVLSLAACKAAIKAGQRLSDREIEQLLDDRDRTERAGRCPHGRPTVIQFSKRQLERQFKRT